MNKRTRAMFNDNVLAKRPLSIARIRSIAGWLGLETELMSHKDSFLLDNELLVLVIKSAENTPFSSLGIGRVSSEHPVPSPVFVVTTQRVLLMNSKAVDFHLGSYSILAEIDLKDLYMESSGELISFHKQPIGELSTSFWFTLSRRSKNAPHRASHGGDFSTNVYDRLRNYIQMVRESYLE